MAGETFYCSCGEDFDERQLLENHKSKCPEVNAFQEVDDLKEKDGYGDLVGGKTAKLQKAFGLKFDTISSNLVFRDFEPAGSINFLS